MNIHNDPASAEPLAAQVAELREGQHELLLMFEELRDRYPKHCLCADVRDRAHAEVWAADVLAAEPNHEDYTPQ